MGGDGKGEVEGGGVKEKREVGEGKSGEEEEGNGGVKEKRVWGRKKGQEKRYTPDANPVFSPPSKVSRWYKSGSGKMVLKGIIGL
jgi:hypothetical protein